MAGPRWGGGLHNDNSPKDIDNLNALLPIIVIVESRLKMYKRF